MQMDEKKNVNVYTPYSFDEEMSIQKNKENENENEHDVPPSQKRTKGGRCIFFLKTQYQICILCIMLFMWFIEFMRQWITDIFPEDKQTALFSKFLEKIANKSVN